MDIEQFELLQQYKLEQEQSAQYNKDKLMAMNLRNSKTKEKRLQTKLFYKNRQLNTIKQSIQVILDSIHL